MFGPNDPKHCVKEILSATARVHPLDRIELCDTNERTEFSKSLAGIDMDGSSGVTETATLSDLLLQILKASDSPLDLKAIEKKLKPSYPKGSKKQPKPTLPSLVSIQRELDDVIASQKVFEHPPIKNDAKRYAVTPPRTPIQIVTELVTATLAGGSELFTEDKLARKPNSLDTESYQTALQAVIQKLLDEKRLFEYPPKGKKRQYGINPPPKFPTAFEIVQELVAATLQTKAGPFTEAELATKSDSIKKPADFKNALAEVIEQLLKQGRLFEHPSRGKKKQYGPTPPPPPPPPPKWYETTPYKKPLEALVKSAEKVRSLGEATLDEILAHLRDVLTTAKPAADKSPAVVVPPPVIAAPPPPPVEQATNLRAELKAAYDHLCLFVEFRDKLVELPRLYHETVKRVPGLSPGVFKDELRKMSDEWLIELHVLNEVITAKEPELAIHRNDRLYYFARWK